MVTQLAGTVQGDLQGRAQVQWRQGLEPRLGLRQLLLLEPQATLCRLAPLLQATLLLDQALQPRPRAGVGQAQAEQVFRLDRPAELGRAGLDAPPQRLDFQAARLDALGMGAGLQAIFIQRADVRRQGQHGRIRAQCRQSFFSDLERL